MTSPKPQSNTPKENRLNAIIAEYLKRKDAGRPVDHDKLLDAYPDLRDDLQSWFSGEALVEDSKIAATKLRAGPRPTDMRDTIQPGAIDSDTASEFNVRNFGRYQLLRPLGEGAMGSVYLAKDSTLDRLVALKMPKVEGSNNSEFMLRFTREARAAAALKHENICSVYDAGEQDGVAYITMDYIEGAPLSRFIASTQLSSLDSILAMVDTIADAVGHAHENGIVHRDLKPGNIIVDGRLKPFVTDFGLARRMNSDDESRITQEGLLIGTPAYMAPEQIKGQQKTVGPRSDIYSLGVILFELLTARLPFEGRIAELLAKSLRDDPPVPSRIRKDLPEDVDDICLKMLKKDPRERYASMAEVKQALQQLRQKIKASGNANVNDNSVVEDQSPLEKYESHIGLMLKNGQYAEAIQNLRQMTTDTREGSKTIVEWARKKLPAVKKESRALDPAGINALLATAEEMFKGHDYRGCIQLIEDVPELRRNDEMEDLLRRAEQTEIDAEGLLAEIKTLERKESIAGLQPRLKKFLKLKPGNKYARGLWEALQTYGKNPAAQRRYRFEAGRLQPIPETNLFTRWVIYAVLTGLLVFASVYSYTIIYLRSGQQTLAVHVDDDWLQSQGGDLTLSVDGNAYAISSDSDGSQPVSVVVSFGSHSFSVTNGGAVVHDPRTFEITKDGRQVLYISPVDIELLSRPKTQGLSSDESNTMKTANSDTDNGERTISEHTEDPASSTSESASTVPQLAKTPFLRREAQQYQNDWAQYVGEPVECTNGCEMKLKLIPAGEFLMGAAEDEEPRFENEGPQHPVRLTEPYYLGVTEVTQKQWFDVMGTKPWQGIGAEGDNQPVAFINRTDAEAFCEKLSAREKQTYRLPTEAEWEFACRGGTQLPYGFASYPARLREFAWFENTIYGDLNPPEEPGAQHVALKEPNVFGLYDMQGNMFEWCRDAYSDLYPADTKIRVNPVNLSTSDFGIIRGGSWANPVFDCRPTTRGKYEVTNRGGGYLGFRAMRVISGSTETNASVTTVATSEDFSEVHAVTESELLSWADSLPQRLRPSWISEHLGSREVLFNAIATHSNSSADWKLMAIPWNDSETWARMNKTHRIMLHDVCVSEQSARNIVLYVRTPEKIFYCESGIEEMPEHLAKGLTLQRVHEGEKQRRLPRSLHGTVAKKASNRPLRFDLVSDWMPYRECEWKLDMSFEELISSVDEYRQKGWRPHIVNSINQSSPQRFFAVFFDNPQNETWSFFEDLSESQYNLCLRSREGQPRCVISRDSDGERLYSVVWDGTLEGEIAATTSTSPGTSPLTKPGPLEINAPGPNFDETENKQLNAQLATISQVHGANEEQLQRWASELPDTYRPYWISVRSAGKQALFDALARKAPNEVEWKLEIVNFDDTERYEEVTEGYAHVMLNAFIKDGILRKQLLLVRHNPGGQFWYGGNDYIGERIQDGFGLVETDMDEVQHAIPTHLSSMYLNGGIHTHLCQAYGPYEEGEFLTDLRMGEVESMLMRYHQKGWRLHLLAGIRGSNEPRFNAIFVKHAHIPGSNSDWAVSPRLTVAQYEEILVKVDAMGGRPRCVTSTIEDGQVIYSVLWDEIGQIKLKDISILADPDSQTARANNN